MRALDEVFVVLEDELDLAVRERAFANEIYDGIWNGNLRMRSVCAVERCIKQYAYLRKPIQDLRRAQVSLKPTSKCVCKRTDIISSV